jgi:hypothetical protein
VHFVSLFLFKDRNSKLAARADFKSHYVLPGFPAWPVMMDGAKRIAYNKASIMKMMPPAKTQTGEFAGRHLKL